MSFPHSWCIVALPTRIHVLNVQWVISSFQTSSRTHIHNLLLKMSGKSFYHTRNYLTPAMLYFYKNQIRPQIEYCCHIWGWSSKVSVRLREWLIFFQSTPTPLSHRRHIACHLLLCRCFLGLCSGALHSLFSLIQTFTTGPNMPRTQVWIIPEFP